MYAPRRMGQPAAFLWRVPADGEFGRRFGTTGRPRHSRHVGSQRTDIADRIDLVESQGILADRRHGERHVLQSLRSEEHTSELQSLMRISYAVFCLKKKNK